MKTLLLVLSILFSLSTFATEILVWEKPSWKVNEIKGIFGVNKNLGRSWVEVHGKNLFNDGYSTETVRGFELIDRVKLENLSFDINEEAVLLDIDGKITECAKIKHFGRSIFKYSKLQNTNCKFVTRKIKKTFDDGFEIKTVTYVQLFLVTKE